MKIQICFKLPEQERELSDARFGAHYRQAIEITLRQLQIKMDSGDSDRQAYRNIYAKILETLESLKIHKQTLDV